MKHARAILWAQWRTIRNYPRLGAIWPILIGVVWYGGWLLEVMVVARVVADPSQIGLVRTAFPGALVLVFLYWQVMPLLLAATGASLDLRKLQAYPIPVSQLFVVEVMLRVTAAIEMFILLLGAAAGFLLNPRSPKAGLLALFLYI